MGDQLLFDLGGAVKWLLYSRNADDDQLVDTVSHRRRERQFDAHAIVERRSEIEHPFEALLFHEPECVGVRIDLGGEVGRNCDFLIDGTTDRC